MNFFDGISGRMRVLRNYFLRKAVVSSLPLEIGIEVTNRCNLKCLMCAREEMTRPIGDMSFDLLKKILDEVKSYAELVYLHGDGEPFLYSQLFESIRYAKNNKLNVGMSTNAVFLNRDNAKLLIDSKIDYLIIALDGFTKETYEKIRVNGNYEQVLANVQNFMEAKIRSKSKIFTVIQFIEMEENRHEVQAFYEHWKKYSPSAIRIKPYVRLIGNELNQTKFNSPCFYLWRQAMIDWDGTVFPCCVDTNSKYNLGNVSNKRLSEIWNDSPMVRFRTAHLNGRQNKIDICNTCDMPQLNNVAVLGSSFFDSCFSKKMLPQIERLAYLSRNVFRRNKFNGN